MHGADASGPKVSATSYAPPIQDIVFLSGRSGMCTKVPKKFQSADDVAFADLLLLRLESGEDSLWK